MRKDRWRDGTDAHAQGYLAHTIRPRAPAREHRGRPVHVAGDPGLPRVTKMAETGFGVFRNGLRAGADLFRHASLSDASAPQDPAARDPDHVAEVMEKFRRLARESFGGPVKAASTATVPPHGRGLSANTIGFDGQRRPSRAAAIVNPRNISVPAPHTRALSGIKIAGTVGYRVVRFPQTRTTIARSAVSGFFMRVVLSTISARPSRRGSELPQGFQNWRP